MAFERLETFLRSTLLASWIARRRMPSAMGAKIPPGAAIDFGYPGQSSATFGSFFSFL